MRRSMIVLLFTFLLGVSPGLAQNDTAERISFPAGGTSAQISGQVAEGFSNSYLLEALAGQMMTITLDNATLTVVSPSGEPLVRGTVTEQPVRSFNQTLPETGDYQLIVSTPVGSGTAAYTLSVSVTGGGDRTQSLERIRFQVGSMGTQLSGRVTGAAANQYVLFALGGQTMNLTLDNATLSVISPSGQPLVQGDRTAEPVRRFSQVLSESGDYEVIVTVPADAPPADYTLTVSVTGVTGPTSTSERIAFETGATSAAVSGQLVEGETDIYVLEAFAGQTITLNVSGAFLTVVSPSGIPLARAQNNVQSVSQVLPETGDYVVQLSTPAGSGTSNYTLTAAITGLADRTAALERVRFQPGATSAQLTGQISGTDDHRYVLFASAGQTMQIVVDNADLTILSPSGTPLARSGASAQPVRNFAQILQESGDYQVIVTLPTGSESVAYTINVSITQ